MNTVVMTAAAPSYGPADGRALVATSVLSGDDHGLEPVVRARLAELHGASVSDWEHLASYVVPRALPAMPAPHRLRQEPQVGGIWVCGDHRDTSSIQGALASGRRVATAVLDELGVSRRPG
ncbi:MAG: FAD-dependent oxidoreductase [Actinomycetes bacterium]